MSNIVAIDAECTYVEDVRDIKSLGVTTYIHHPETEHFMVSMWCPEWNYVGPWEKAPLDRIDGDSTILLSHNRSFDSAVLSKMAPTVKPKQWICTADQAAMNQVPRPLSGAAKVVLGIKVDKKVRDEMNGKTVASMTPEFLERARAYALEDSRICYELHKKLEPFTELEQTVSEHTTWMGLRGIRVDVAKIAHALESLTQQVYDLQRKIPWHGELDAKGKEVKLGSPKALARECNKAGIPAPESTAKNSPEFDKWAEQYADKAPFVKALSDLRSCNRLLTVVQAFETRRQKDILPYGLKYCGAQHTRRWSGDDGLNLQNLPRKAMFGVDVRAFLIPREGFTFVSADYSQIEARVLPWIAGDKALLELLASGMDIYEAHARATMGYTDPRPLKEVDPAMRQFAKPQVLGLGFRLGAVGFQAYAKTSAGIDLSLAECKAAVDAYRAKNKPIVNLWSVFDRSMRKQCIQDRGGDFEIDLPSGRTIRYHSMHEDGGIRASKVKGEAPGYWHGGVATENCLAGSSEVLTRDGWVRIDSVNDQDVWDGEEWVAHQGLIKQGVQRTIACFGLRCTPDHRVLSECGWISAEYACKHPDGVLLLHPYESTTSPHWAAFREANSCCVRWASKEKEFVGSGVRLRESDSEGRDRDSKQGSTDVREVVRLHKSQEQREIENSRDVSTPSVRCMEIDACALSEPQAQSVQELRRSGDSRVPSLGGFVRGVLECIGSDVSTGYGLGSDRQPTGIQAGELPLDDENTELSEQASVVIQTSRTAKRFLGRDQSQGLEENHGVLSDKAWVDVGADHKHTCESVEPTFDLRNCGPRQRFVARGGPGKPALIVHNCVQGIARDILANAIANLRAASVPVVLHVHDEVLAEVPIDIKEEGRQAVITAMETLPDWAAGLPLKTDARLLDRYTK